MKKLNVKITGTSPMIMHADTLADPLREETIAHKEVSSKRKKTREDIEWLAKSEWKNSLYFGSDGKTIILPTLNLRATLIEGSKLNRLGMAVKRGVHFDMRDNPLVYDGPKKLSALWKDKRFVDARSVRVSTSKIIRYRPIFPEWSVEFSVMYDDEIISQHDLEMCFINAGLYSGLGDFRPLFGRFECKFK